METCMKGLTLEAITAACHGRYYGDEKLLQTEVTAITTDSRKVEKGGLFIAICGARSDGHDYINECLEKGAVCAISEKELPGAKGTYIQVQSSLQALKDIATLYRSNLSVKVVGITGSVGKTSTKETIATVLAKKYKVLKTQGNFNNEIGLPLTIFRLKEDDEIAVLEMGISDFHEMSRLTAIAKPDVCVITNIGLCHLENLKTRDGILKAKTEIFEGMNPQGTVILNGDDDKLVTVSEVYGKKPIFFGEKNQAGIYATEIEDLGLEGTKCTIWNLPKEANQALTGVSQPLQRTTNMQVTIPVPGKHMVFNAMAAAAVATVFGLSDEQIREGISELETISGRNHIIKTDSFLIVDDCYNANPVSMKASIDVLATAKGRKVAILGSMFELGENECALHEEVGNYLAGKGIDVLLTAGALGGYIAKGAGEQAQKSGVSLEVHAYDTRDELLTQGKQLLQKGDNILVKASHGMEFPEVVKQLQNFDQ